MTTTAARVRSAERGEDRRRATRALQALDVFMADMQAGIGPFLGVFPQQRGGAAGPIGSVMAAGGGAGMAMTVPAGAFIDHTEKKRLVVIVTSTCTMLASFPILLSQAGWVVTVRRVATAIAGAAIGPAVAGWCCASPSPPCRCGDCSGAASSSLGAYDRYRRWTASVQGVGAAPSPAIGGWPAQAVGYRLAFYILGGFALASLALWIGFAAILRPACDGAPPAETA